jgi:hypothetical protein
MAALFKKNQQQFKSLVHRFEKTSLGGPFETT